MNRLIKSIAAFVAGCVALVGLAVAVTHLWPDEPILPEAAAWLNEVPSAPEPQLNAYFWMLGFLAPADQDPQAVGEAFSRKMAQPLNAATATQDAASKSQARPLTLATDLLATLCKPAEPSCLSQLTDAAATLRKGREESAILLDRYRSLYARPFFHDPSSPGLETPLPDFYMVNAVHRLLLANIYLDASEGEVTDAIEALSQDIRWSRTFLAQVGGLLPKVIAANLLAQDLHLLSGIMSLHPDAEIPDAAALLQPLSASELDLEPSMRLEFRTLANAFTTLPSVSAAAENILPASAAPVGYLLAYKPQATLNRVFQEYRSYAELSHAPRRDFPGRGSTIEHFDPEWTDYAINPVGMILLEVAIPSLSRYAGRVRDVDALLLLVAIKHEVLAQRLQTEAIAALVAAKSDEADLPPGTVKWDPDAGLFSVDGMGGDDAPAVTLSIK